jgi:hypothetical protein
MRNFFRRLLVLLVIGFAAGKISAHGGYAISFPHAFGGGYELAYSSARSENAALHSVFASYRSGFISGISALWGADLGYRFAEQTWRGRVGVEALVLFVGLQTGIIADKTSDGSRFGGYVGIGGALAGKNPAEAITLYAGGNFVSGLGPEMYLRLTYFIVP